MAMTKSAMKRVKQKKKEARWREVWMARECVTGECRREAELKPGTDEINIQGLLLIEPQDLKRKTDIEEEEETEEKEVGLGGEGMAWHGRTEKERAKRAESSEEQTKEAARSCCSSNQRV